MHNYVYKKVCLLCANLDTQCLCGKERRQSNVFQVLSAYESSDELDTILCEEWEPFAVVHTNSTNPNTVYLKKLKEESR